MKNFLTFLGIGAIAVGILFGYSYFRKSDSVSVTEFRDAHELLNKRIDSLAKTLDNVNLSVDSVKNEVRTLSKNVDSLKKGQEIIFNEVKKTSDKTFWDMF